MTASVDQQAANIPVIDYEGSQYRADFWLGQGREYEDAAERLALQRLMPAHGGRIAEIGAGFGRLAAHYAGYDQVVLFDYSRTLLQDAARDWGHDPRFVFVAGNIYDLPLATGTLDTLMMVRVMHHLADVPAALRQLRRTLHRHSVAVLEYANKRNLKALMRWGARRQTWSPFDPAPVEFVELNFDFHPGWMEDQLSAAGISIRQQYAVSHFRLPWLKQRVSAARLAEMDSWLFAPGGVYPFAPSVFVQVAAPGAGPRPEFSTAPGAIATWLRCPQCQQEGLEQIRDDRMQCPQCGQKYRRYDGVWDLKEPTLE
ncbi:MAG: class I SAM-dependent methyltransferase [Anaerolineales bacterium]|nr:class I SAM-dependent methyltransferase [Anaerolineales bacterium]